MPVSTELYDRLEISPEASKADITKAYRRLSKIYHPDRQETGDASKFAAIAEAYSILKNPSTRQEYDTIGNIKNSSFKIRQEAITAIVTIFDDILTKADIPISQVKVMETITARLNQALASEQETIRRIDATRQELRSTLDKIAYHATDSGRDNLFTRVIHSRLESLAKNEVICRNKEEIFKAALEEMESYSTVEDMVVSPVFTFCNNSASTTSSTTSNSFTNMNFNLRFGP